MFRLLFFCFFALAALQGVRSASAASAASCSVMDNSTCYEHCECYACVSDADNTIISCVDPGALCYQSGSSYHWVSTLRGDVCSSYKTLVWSLIGVFSGLLLCCIVVAGVYIYCVNR